MIKYSIELHCSLFTGYCHVDIIFRRTMDSWSSRTKSKTNTSLIFVCVALLCCSSIAAVVPYYPTQQNKYMTTSSAKHNTTAISNTNTNDGSDDVVSSRMTIPDNTGELTLDLIGPPPNPASVPNKTTNPPSETKQPAGSPSTTPGQVRRRVQMFQSHQQTK